jgi:hypothetical protein
MVRACSTNGEERNAYRGLEEPEGKRQLLRPRRRQVDIKMDLN